MKDFLEYLVKNIVDSPEEVDIKVLEGETINMVEIRVESGDIAKVIGREGRTIKALRTIAGTVAARFGKKVRLEMIQ